MRLCTGLVVFAFAGCNSLASHPPVVDDEPFDAAGGTNQGPITNLPASTTASFAVEVGGMVPVSPGVSVGYALTTTQALTYTLRWTGDAKIATDGFSNFYGAVLTTGHFTALVPGCVNQTCPLESGDVVSGIEPIVGGGERIAWNTNASSGWDGFSFTTDAEPVYFDVFVDGERHPELFFFATPPDGQSSSPKVSPFGITSQSVTGDAAAE